jgi:hypothetical protein
MRYEVIEIGRNGGVGGFTVMFSEPSRNGRNAGREGDQLVAISCQKMAEMRVCHKLS